MNRPPTFRVVRDAMPEKRDGTPILIPCGICQNGYTDHKMTASKRDHAASVDPHMHGRDQPGPQYWRICLDCEVKERAREHQTWASEEQASEPNYADRRQAWKDIKLANKGNLWINQGSAMSAAREEIRERQREGIRYDRCERRREVLEQSKALADGLLDAP